MAVAGRRQALQRCQTLVSLLSLSLPLIFSPLLLG